MKIVPGGLYRHVKTEKVYLVHHVILNATNAQDGQEMVLYQALATGTHYVRALEEFVGTDERGNLRFTFLEKHTGVAIPRRS